jgi:CHASE3 domain sensor protein
LRDVAGKIAAKNYMQLSSLEEDLVDKVRDRLENDPEMEVSFRDLKELSIAKANAFRETMTTRGEATSISEERKVITQEDYEDTLKAARERLEAMKRVDEAEIIEESDD